MPVGLIGADQVQAPGQRLPRWGKPVTIHFGSPLRADPAPADHRAHLRDLTDRLMTEIAGLSGLDYTDHYAEVVRT